jgi:hypothetical protein
MRQRTRRRGGVLKILSAVLIQSQKSLLQKIVLGTDVILRIRRGLKRIALLPCPKVEIRVPQVAQGIVQGEEEVMTRTVLLPCPKVGTKALLRRHPKEVGVALGEGRVTRRALKRTALLRCPKVGVEVLDQRHPKVRAALGVMGLRRTVLLCPKVGAEVKAEVLAPHQERLEIRIRVQKKRMVMTGTRITLSPLSTLSLKQSHQMILLTTHFILLHLMKMNPRRCILLFIVKTMRSLSVEASVKTQ